MLSRPIIAPSVLAADFSNLESEVKMLNESAADLIHVDIMDGLFVPNLSMGLPVVDAIKRHARKPLDVHLMIVQPERYVESFYKAGAEIISVHVEACPHLHRNIQQIKVLGIKAGVAINPHTSITELENIITDVDTILIMSVNPGFGAQKFIENTYRKVAALKKMITESGSKALIEIDGGVTMQNAKQLLDAGADILVAGNFVFSAPDPKSVISQLKSVLV
ncbi:MAG TPA: ribulose-phosphate 3-epimerase [Cyclobacteriaceae bacterium]|nr:ribulose-phosphate 3-epimerase [Cyclobacteriaceae bacterium]